MIELIVLNHLKEKLIEPVHLEKQNNSLPYILFERVSPSGKTNHLPYTTMAFQSYDDSLYNAALLNEKVKQAVESLIELNEIRGLDLNSDYNFTDTTTKEYRYQAVYEIRYY